MEQTLIQDTSAACDKDELQGDDGDPPCCPVLFPVCDLFSTDSAELYGEDPSGTRTMSSQLAQ